MTYRGTSHCIIGIPLKCNSYLIPLSDRSPSSAEFDLPDNVQRYCSDVKSRYTLQSVLPESAWPPSVGRKYVELALIDQERCDQTCASVIKQQTDYTRGNYDKIFKYKTKIDLKEAFGAVFCEGGTEIWPLRMLIDGAPGVGKTTLSRKVSRKWAKGKILTKYWLVLLLHLRERAISKAKTIDDFFYHDDPDIKRDVIKFVRKNSGNGVLIIFDGFDELSSYERSEESLFLDVSMGKILPMCAVVITSRPYASRTIQELPSINRHIEVLGFTEEQVEDCIKYKIKDPNKAQELCMELKERLDIASICQIPLNCSIVLYVYEQQNYCLPSTLTELYDKFVLHTFKRYIKRTLGNRAANKLRKIEELQNPSREHFKLLCKLAVEGLEADKLVFPMDDLKEIFPVEYQSDIDLPVLDLMTSAKSYSVDGREDTYNFLHLTIQEFLAAYWIAHYLPDTEKLQCYQKKLEKNRFRMVLLFLSGMTKLEFHMASSVFSQELWIRDKVLVCHLCYESQNNSMCQVVAKNCCNSSKVSLSGSRFETLVVSNFVAYSECQWPEFLLRPDDTEVVRKVFKDVCNTTSIEKVIVSFGHTSTNLMLLTYLEELNQVNRVCVTIAINGGLYAPDVKHDKEIMSAFTRVLSSLKNKRYSITLASSLANDYRNKVVVQFCEILAQGLLQNVSVTEIVLNCVLPQDVKPIFKNLSRNLGLQHIVCTKEERRCSQSVREAESKEFCATFETFLSSNTSLKQINLDIGLDNKIISSYIEAIISGLASNTTLQSLTICPREIAFERNQQTGKMEFIGNPKFKPKQTVLHTPSIFEQAESSGGRYQNTDLRSSLPPPPAKRPCERSSPLRNNILSHNLCLSSTPTELQTLAQLSVSVSSQQGLGYGQASGPLSVITNQPQSVPPTSTSPVHHQYDVKGAQSNPSQDVIVVTETSPSHLGNTFVTQYCNEHSSTESSNSSPIVTQNWPPHPNFFGVPAHYAMSPPTQFLPPSVNYFVNRFPNQEQMSYGYNWAQSYPTYAMRHSPHFGTGGMQQPQIIFTPGQSNFVPMPMQNEWQHKPMHQVSASAPVYMVHPMVPSSWPVYNDYQYQPPNVIVTTTSTCMLPTSSRDSSTH